MRRSDDREVSARFTAAYDLLSPRVLGYLRSHGVDDPESVTNEVFLALYQTFDRISGGDDEVRTLTFSIAHARLVDHYRRRATRPATIVFDPEADPRRSPSAEDDASTRLGEHGVLPLLARLGHDQREAVLLRIVAGLSLEETALVMQKSVGAVKQLQRRALLSLRVALGGQDDDD
ncbi:MAG TPA: RNA polymerase sigma factor [Pseudolysinimonas sp.]